MNAAYGQLNAAYGQLNAYSGHLAGEVPDSQLARDIDQCWAQNPRNFWSFFSGMRQRKRDDCIDAANDRFEARQAITETTVETEKKHKQRKAAREQEERRAAQQTSPVTVLAGLALVAAVAGTIYMTRPKG